MTTLTDTRKAVQEARWQSKVDDQGNTHVYRKITAAELKVGDHLLEHVIGHKRQVATPILGLRQVPDGVILTIPDRHGDNAPVDELYKRDDPVFISRTPHLEQYHPEENFLLSGKQETARIKPMEQQTETPRKPEYPRMESHLKDQEGTWHSVSLYLDKENHPRGMVSIENKSQGIAEKYPVEFTERVSQKTGERFLTAKVDREGDSKPLHVNLMPFTGRDEVRGMRATFAERDVSLPKSQQFTPVGDGSALMKPNVALLQHAEKDRTAAFLRDKLNMDPVVAQQRFYDLIKTGPSQVNADLLAKMKQPAGKESQGLQR